MSKYFILAMMGWLFTTTTSASVVGTFGETFPIAEKSLLILLKERLQQIDLSDIQERWVKEVSNYAKRPTSMNLLHAQKHHHQNFDPTIILTQDILDSKSHVLFAKGTKVNPLEYLPSYQPHWIFIDADDEKQLNYTQKKQKQFPDLKIILIKGDVPNTANLLNKEVYFDQGGNLIARFEITETPAFISRNGDLLVIEYGVFDA